MKKVLFILHYPPPVHGAAMVGQYIRESEKVNSAFDCQYINLGTSERVDEIGKGGLKKWLRFFAIFWQTFKSLLIFRPQLVYFTLTASGVGFYKDAVIALLAKLFRKKVVYHFHNKGVRNRQDKWFDSLLYKIVFRNSEVILLAKELYADVEKYVPENSVNYCPNGIPNITIPKGIITNSKVAEILFLSNLIASKGVTVLLEACKILKAKKLPFVCTFIGGEGDITAVDFQRQLKSFALESHVKYVGKKYGADKERSYAAADIFTLPTHYPNECFPLVLIEAMQFSLPLVSTFEGGIPSLIAHGKTGFLVPQHDATALADKLEQLILDPSLRAKMGHAGREQYESALTLVAFEERFTSILHKILNKSGPS